MKIKFDNSQLQAGFTIVEVLVVAAILAIIGYMMADIVTRSLSGSQKTVVIGNTKQNGQVAMDAITQVIRNSELVVCLDSTWAATGGVGNLIVFYSQDGRYVRIRIVPAGLNGPNGYFAEDFPAPTFLLNGDPYTSAPNSSRRLCNTDPVTGVAVTDEIILTDRDANTGVNVQPPSPPATTIFIVTKNPGSKDSVTVQFGVNHAANAQSGFQYRLASPTQFRETIQLRQR